MTERLQQIERQGAPSPGLRPGLITLPDGTTTSFETGLDGWAITGPDTSAPNVNNFVRTDASGFPVGDAIATPDSLLLGFGLEAVSTADERNALMGRALEHLLE